MSQLPPQPFVYKPFVKPDFVPPASTLPLLPELVFIARVSQPQRYTKAIDFISQVAPTLATLPTLPPSMNTPVAARSLPPTFAQIEIARQVAPTLATLPTLPPGQDADPSLPQVYRTSTAIAPPIAPYVSPFTLSSWLPTVGAPTFAKFNQIEVARQVFPTLATLPTLCAYMPTTDRGQPPFFRASDWTMPPLANFVSPFTLSSWLPTLGIVNYETYTKPDVFVEPFPNTPPAAVTIANWFSTDAARAIVLRYSPTPDFSAPAKFAIITPSIVFLPGWQDVDGPRAVQLVFQQTSPYQPPAIFSAPVITLAMWSPTVGASTFSRFAQIEFAAPAKFNLTTPATSFIPGWLTTDADQAIVLRYAATSLSSPDKATVSTPTLGAWTTTDAAKAQPLDYAPTRFIAPEKVLPFPNVQPPLVWIPTIGLKAQPQNFASTFAIAPVFVFPFVGPFVLTAVLRHRVYSQLQATHTTYSQLATSGSKTFSQLVAQSIEIVGLT